MNILPLLQRLSDDRVAAFLELERDAVFKHLSAAERCHFITHSLQVGQQQAALYREISVTDLAALTGLQVVVQERYIGGALTVRATYDAKTRTVELQQSSLEQVHQCLNRLSPGAWSWRRVYEIHLAHEVFHHLEETRITPVHEQLPLVPTFSVGRMTITRSRALKCREIAAHAFTKELLGLQFLPNVVEYLLLIEQNRCTLSQLDAALDKACHAL